MTVRGERELWLEFVHKAKREKKKVWDVLSHYLKERNLLDELIQKENPEELIEEAVREYLAAQK